jgi:hypothetical protein
MPYYHAHDLLNFLHQHNAVQQPLSEEVWNYALNNAISLLNQDSVTLPYPLFLSALLTDLVRQIELYGNTCGYHKGDLLFQSFLYGDQPRRYGWFDVSQAMMTGFNADQLAAICDALAKLDVKTPFEWYQAAATRAASFAFAQRTQVDEQLQRLELLNVTQALGIEEYLEIMPDSLTAELGLLHKKKATRAQTAPPMHAPPSAGFVSLVAQTGTGRDSPLGFP